MVIDPHNEPRKRVIGAVFFPLMCAGMLLFVAIAAYEVGGFSMVFAVACGCVTSCLHAAWHNYRSKD